MTYCFDLDGTICYTSNKGYQGAVPYLKVIDKINRLYEDGHTITIFTARGGTSKVDYYDITSNQLKSWGLKYHNLICKGKPHFDLLVDDKAINANKWRKDNKINVIGFVASCFDLLHAGHCLYLEEARKSCDFLIAALQTTPAGRPDKNIPVQSTEERLIQLKSVKYVDEVRLYTTEEELEKLLEEIKPDIRILGSDAKGKPITGEKFCKQIVFHDRGHNWSTSELRKRVYEANN